MKLARYWTRSSGEATDSEGQRIQVVTRGWSDESIDHAKNVAAERAGRLAQRIASDPSARKDYDYDEAPVPEAVVRDLRSEGLAAVVTRNSYGALVLNADNLLFADVDDEGSDDQPGAGNPDRSGCRPRAAPARPAAFPHSYPPPCRYGQNDPLNRERERSFRRASLDSIRGPATLTGSQEFGNVPRHLIPLGVASLSRR